MQFTVHRDAEFGFIVADASVRARSFAMVPVAHRFDYEDKVDALAQAKRLTEMGVTIQCRMIETPERFEEVADTLYGAAW